MKSEAQSPRSESLRRTGQTLERLKRCAYVHIHRHSTASMSSMHNKFYKTSEQSAQAENRARELYTPRRTHVNPAMPAWRRMYWEKVKKCRDARSRSRIVLEVEGTDLSSFSFPHCTDLLRIFFLVSERESIARPMQDNEQRSNNCSYGRSFHQV